MKIADIFAKFRNRKSSQKIVPKPIQDWSIFNRENTGVIAIDRNCLQIHNFGFEFVFAIEYLLLPSHLNPQRMPLKETSNYFFELEEAFEVAIPSVLKLASLTAPSKRTVWFAVQDASLFSQSKNYFDKSQNIAITVKPESIGSVSSLMPTVSEIHKAENKQILQTLLDNGDNGSKKRVVTHIIYYDEHWENNKLLVELKAHNFDIADIGNGRVEFTKFTKLNIESIDHDTDLLNEIAMKYGANYDGWGSPVLVKNSRKLN